MVELFSIAAARYLYHFNIEKYVHKMFWSGSMMNTFELLPQKIDVDMFKKFTSGVRPTLKNSVSIKKPVQIRNGDELIVLKPKSMSLFHHCALIWDTMIANQLEKIDYETLISLLAFIEKEHASARMYKNKERGFYSTKKLLFANFCHLLTANKQEPHWHWHCVILPFTENDQKIYALQNGLIIRSALLYGFLYRAQLLKTLLKSGIAIRITDYKNGFFEIADVPEATIKLFSSRSLEIKKHKNEYSARYTMASDQKTSYLAKFKDRLNTSELNIVEIIKTNVNKIEKSGFSREMFSKIIFSDRDVESLDLPFIIHKIYQKNGEQIFSFSHEWLFHEIAKISIQLKAGANISEITEPFKGGNHVEVTKKFIEIQKQKIIEGELHAHKKRNHEFGIVAGNAKLHYENTRRVTKKSRTASRYFEQNYFILDDTTSWPVYERLLNLQHRESGSNRDKLGAFASTKTVGDNVFQDGLGDEFKNSLMLKIKR